MSPGEVPRAVQCPGARATTGRGRTRGTAACRPPWPGSWCGRPTRPRPRRSDPAAKTPRPAARRSAGRTVGRCGGRNGLLASPSRPSFPAMAPVVSYSASWAMRRAWRSSPLNGVAMNVSMNSDGLLEGVLPRPDGDQVGVVVLPGRARRSRRSRPTRRGRRAPCWPPSARRCRSRRR